MMDVKRSIVICQP